MPTTWETDIPQLFDEINYVFICYSNCIEFKSIGDLYFAKVILKGTGNLCSQILPNGYKWKLYVTWEMQNKWNGSVNIFYFNFTIQNTNTSAKFYAQL